MPSWSPETRTSVDGSTPEQMERNREAIRARGAMLGFTFNMEQRSRIYNTLDAHRLLHWAGLEGRQHGELQVVVAGERTAPVTSAVPLHRAISRG
jgi:predicted DsbA family dithiol-disulfide isomerase